jgi:hypothetical protein
MNYEPGIIPGRQMRQNEMASLAMRMPSDLGSSGLGSVQRRESNETNMFSQELEMRKESRFNSVKLVKRKIQISYKLEYNNFML